MTVAPEAVLALTAEDPELLEEAVTAEEEADAVVAAVDAAVEAVLLLTGVGADRDAAQLWFELADLLEEVGDVDGARNAYRSAAASSGLRSRTKLRSTVMH